VRRPDRAPEDPGREADGQRGAQRGSVDFAIPSQIMRFGLLEVEELVRAVS